MPKRSNTSSAKSFVETEFIRDLKKVIRLNEDARHSRLKEFGFKQIVKKGMLGGEFWRHSRLGIVLKAAFLLGPNPPKAVKCPTIELGKAMGFTSRWWLCQPVVNRSRRASALEAVKARLPDPSEYDLHAGQCGHLNDKPVLFDW